MNNKVLNVPNTLSLIRVFLAPLVLLFLSLRISTPVVASVPSVSWGDVLAAAVFIVASITDAFDGYIARKYKLVTTLGKFIDPLADKVLVIAAMLALIELGRLPAWIVMVIIVTGLRLVAAAEGVVIAASKGGKLKTCFQIAALIMLILNIPGGMWLMWAAMILTVWSGMDYLIKGSSIITG